MTKNNVKREPARRYPGDVPKLTRTDGLRDGREAGRRDALDDSNGSRWREHNRDATIRRETIGHSCAYDEGWYAGWDEVFTKIKATKKEYIISGPLRLPKEIGKVHRGMCQNQGVFDYPDFHDEQLGKYVLEGNAGSVRFARADEWGYHRIEFGLDGSNFKYELPVRPELARQIKDT